ncbi:MULTISPECIES: alpha/beta fold hydrolase [unclassified Crossiella]|uniref:alpha/beta fold hydrolase n=1 Tax=unclassified Crossiella TaxID=2620835 RepID=UPI001FFED95C|nr:MULTISPECIES: alpha/beta hydrolase [unclassified Crossiella]MCK2244339.1 alpha/beta hydrolase [Crossiella sp. S99.2]MCK2257833.1 alpha/beta hydrolase [Crossiella sp. S99.1]
MSGVLCPTTTAELDHGLVEYRFDQRGSATVLVLHGGHLNAGLALGEDVFADAGYSVLAPSRPGYGRTPLATGTTTSGFADVLRSLCEHLGIARIAAVVGVSAGGPTAMAIAARHPDLVERVILQSAVGPVPWPDARTRLAARIAFVPATERVTWSVVRAIMRLAPDLGLRLLLGDLAALPAKQVVRALSAEDRRMLIELFSRMRSGEGFRNDLATLRAGADQVVTQPTLVIASRNDGAVPFAHAEALSAAIRHSRLIESAADSHFVWLSHDWPAISGKIRDFLAD